MKHIGVLALQGAIREHLELLNRLPNVCGHPVKTLQELQTIDGLILPGGESTAIGKLLASERLLAPLQAKIKAGLPVWGTCAGMILLAKAIAGQSQQYLQTMDITVKRNAYGSQLDSFEITQTIPAVSKNPVPLVFIRAPYITAAGSTVEILAKTDGKIIAAQQKNMLATSFHPELTADLSFHQYFIHTFIFA